MKKLYSLIFVLALLSACTKSQPNSDKSQEAVETTPVTQNENAASTPQNTPIPEEYSTEGLSPLEAIKDLDQKIESYELGEALTPEQKKKNEELKAKIVRGTFDIGELCRLALAKHWDEITITQQDSVVSLMTRLLEKKALFSKERLSGRDKYYQIEYLSEEIDKQNAEQATVKTRLNVAKRDLKVDIQYKLILTPKGWKIFDLIVDESSMLLNYRSAFHNIITKYGFSELESRMQQKLDEIK